MIALRDEPRTRLLLSRDGLPRPASKGALLLPSDAAWVKLSSREKFYQPLWPPRVELGQDDRKARVVALPGSSITHDWTRRISSVEVNGIHRFHNKSTPDRRSDLIAASA